MNNCFSYNSNDENFKNNVDKCKQTKPSCTNNNSNCCRCGQIYQGATGPQGIPGLTLVPIKYYFK